MCGYLCSFPCRRSANESTLKNPTGIGGKAGALWAPQVLVEFWCPVVANSGIQLLPWFQGLNFSKLLNSRLLNSCVSHSQGVLEHLRTRILQATNSNNVWFSNTMNGSPKTCRLLASWSQSPGVFPWVETSVVSFQVAIPENWSQRHVARMRNGWG